MKIHGLPQHPLGAPSFQMDVSYKKKSRESCSAHHHKRAYRRGKPGGFKGADVWTGCRYSLSPLAAAASQFSPTTPTCLLSIKPTATARASHRPGASVRGRSREISAQRASIGLQAWGGKETGGRFTVKTIFFFFTHTKQHYTLLHKLDLIFKKQPFYI